MITQTQLRHAAFWGEKWICLECGETFESDEAAETQSCCEAPKLADSELAVEVLDNVTEDEE